MVISDFLEPWVPPPRRHTAPPRILSRPKAELLADATHTALRQTHRRHDVVAVHITDPHELTLPSLGRLVLEDAETGEVVEVNTGAADDRTTFAERQARAQAELARLFRSARVDAIQLRTDQPYAAELGRFFEAREKRRLRG